MEAMSKMASVALIELNKVNRATTAGRKTAINLCVSTRGKITINRGKVKG